jgi:hypothetical protein
MEHVGTAAAQVCAAAYRHVEDGALNVEGRLDLAKYRGLQPLYAEYNIGHYSRSFRLSSKIDQSRLQWK